jgi:FtsZ-binding cell division protein ZapB
MRLNEEEIESVKFLVQTYADLWYKNNECERKLEQLTLERNSLVKEIESLDREMQNVKEQESNLQEKLMKKYGNFRLDMETFEIIPNE